PLHPPRPSAIKATQTRLDEDARTMANLTEQCRCHLEGPFSRPVRATKPLRLATTATFESRQGEGPSSPARARNCSDVLDTGNGSSGTGTPSAAHSGPHPSVTRHSTSRFAGARFRTSA